MKKLMAAAALLCGVAALASAQNGDRRYRGEGYLFGAVGASSPANVQLGGGGEGFVYKGIGLGGELYWTLQPSELSGERTGSVDVSYHFAPRLTDRRLEAFVTGGYSFFSRPGTDLSTASGGNLGGGVNVWLKEHAGLRLEVRDVVGGRNTSVEFAPGVTSYFSPQHLVAFRVGVTFR